MASLTDLRTKGRQTTRPWQVRYRDHAGVSRSDQFTRKADAQARLLEVQTAEQTGRIDVLDAGKRPLHEIGAQFYALNRRAWADTTAYGHRVIWNSVVLGEASYPRAAIADMPVRMIRKSHVQEFVRDALSAGVPVSSVRRALSLVTRTLDHAADDDLIGSNPAARVKPPSEPDRPVVYVVTPVQVEAIRAQLEPRDAAIVSIMAYAGLRPAEVRALTAAQLGKPNLELVQSVNDDGTLRALKARKGGDRRDVPVCAALAADLAAIDWGTGYLLKGTDGPWTKSNWANWRNRTFLPAARAAGVTIGRPYDLRHSIASMWLREGIDRVTVADWLGHSVTVLQAHYAHTIKALDPRDRRTVDEIIAEARTRPKA